MKLMDSYHMQVGHTTCDSRWWLVMGLMLHRGDMVKFALSSIIYYANTIHVNDLYENLKTILFYDNTESDDRCRFMRVFFFFYKINSWFFVQIRYKLGMLQIMMDSL